MSNHMLELQSERILFKRLPEIFKKLVLFSATFSFVRMANIENDVALEQV